MQRRSFLAGIGTASLAGITAKAASAQASQDSPPRPQEFTMDFAPHFGMFRHHAGDDPVAQLEFAADQGFSAWEDNGMGSRPPEEQDRIARAMERLGIRMGVFVLNPGSAWGPSFSTNSAKERENFRDATKRAIDTARRVNATWMTVVPGTRELRLDLGYQTASAIDQLRVGAELLEPHRLVMVLEPLNPLNHPNMLLARMSHAYEICRGVNSPSCKILCDLYHQQITEGNLIPNIDRSWDEIAYFQIGDTPGRNEPTTGEINYKRVFAHIKAKGYTGILGMEHGNAQPGVPGERAVINAYRATSPE